VSLPRFPGTRALVLLLTLAGAASWRPAPARAVAPATARGRVEALEFTSDHNLLRHNTTDVLGGGKRYPDVEWTFSPRTNAPITHTGGEHTRIRARITLSLDGIVAGTPYRLEGTSPEPALCFRREGCLAAGERRPLDVEATAPLGRAVRKITAPVRWALTLHPGTPAARRLDLGATGPHVVYVTLGTPRDTNDPLCAVTDVRMDLAVARVAAAMKRAGGSTASPPRIVFELVKEHYDYYQPSRHYDRRHAWKVTESWHMKPAGSSCISIVEFVGLVCKQIGLEGSARMTAFYATAEDPFRAVAGGLGDHPVYKTGYYGERWQLFLIDQSNTNAGQVGGLGGVNYYEAALEYDWKGKKYYYPGGCALVYDTPEKVVSIFRTLAWARYDFALRDWVVMEVVAIYRFPDRPPPANVALP
jgi:hypothetical protein